MTLSDFLEQTDVREKLLASLLILSPGMAVAEDGSPVLDQAQACKTSVMGICVQATNAPSEDLSKLPLCNKAGKRNDPNFGEICAKEINEVRPNPEEKRIYDGAMTTKCVADTLEEALECAEKSE